MATLGYVRGSNGPDLAQIGVNEQLVSHVSPNQPSGVFLAYSVAGYVGRWGGAAVMRFGGWDASSSSAAPGALLFRTEEISPTENYMDGGGGQKLTAKIIDGSNNPTIVAIPASQVVALGAASRNAQAGIAMYQASAISQPNESFYRKSISGTTVQTAAGSSASNEGQLALQVNGDYNVKPNRPGAITITAGETTQRPTFRASFSDPNETVNGIAYDRLETYRMEVWWGGVRRSSETLTASTAERNGRYSQRQSPINIPWDTPYTVFIYHRDRAGLESESRSFSGTINSGPGVDTPTSPSGRVTDPTNPGSIIAVYRSSGSVNANAVRFRLINTAGSPVKSSALIPRTVAPGGNITATWLQSGLGTQANGVTLGLQVQARDINGNWSLWSAPSWFITNAAPSVPALYGPANGAVSSYLYTTSVRVSDPDADNGTATVTAEYYDASDNLLGTLNLPYLPEAGVSIRNVYGASPSSIITSKRVVKWRAKANDGYLDSAWSPMWTFQWADVPSVTITGPTSPIATAQPNITWESTGQTHWRLRGYDGGRKVYDTTVISGDAQSNMVGWEYYWVGGERWNNGEAFDWVVSVRDASTLWGDSAPLTLTLEYPPIETLTIDGASMALPGINGTHYNQ
ncbi:MAG: hypothetical protein K5924_12585, partial [Chloroflexi bacterium]|nr:hypothetical protein [Chloroflexota bacterium]